MSQGKITTHIRLIQSLPRNVFIFKRWTNNFLTIIHLRRNLLTKIMTQRKRFRNESRNQIHSKSISCGAFFYLSFFQLWNYLQPRWKKKTSDRIETHLNTDWTLCYRFVNIFIIQKPQTHFNAENRAYGVWDSHFAASWICACVIMLNM